MKNWRGGIVIIHKFQTRFDAFLSNIQEKPEKLNVVE